MTQEEIAIESEPTYIVALGRDDLADRLQRAQMTYTSARHPPLPRSRPCLIRKAMLSHWQGEHGDRDARPAAGMVVWIPKGEAHIHAAAGASALEFIFLAATGHSSDIVE